MKFVHIADMHFDNSFASLSDKEGLGDIIRINQRKTFKKVIDYIKENQIPYLFISGDLYEQKYIRKSTIEYINNLFKEIKNTKIFIAPGNHDPFIKNSYYNQFNWSENVYIFNSKIEKIELPEADIYGYGFNDFYCKDSGINNFEIENKNKLNILIMHGSIDGGSDENREYNSMSRKMLREKEFDYCALGHIHKPDYNNEERLVYPGSTVAQGFDELGDHGMIVRRNNKK
jgi:DNA repair exonuclease SbcCD nuclease subunit